MVCLKADYFIVYRRQKRPGGRESDFRFGENQILCLQKNILLTKRSEVSPPTSSSSLLFVFQFAWPFFFPERDSPWYFFVFSDGRHL